MSFDCGMFSDGSFAANAESYTEITAFYRFLMDDEAVDEYARFIAAGKCREATPEDMIKMQCRINIIHCDTAITCVTFGMHNYELCGGPTSFPVWVLNVYGLMPDCGVPKIEDRKGANK